MGNAFARIRIRLARPLPLLRYLVLTTETHAFCGSLAFFALLALYPASSLLLSLSRYLLDWDVAQGVLVQALRQYYPEGQEFLLRNLEVTVSRHSRELAGSIVWILLGAAGFFLPLEAAFNRLWGFASPRPYWKNQLVGFLVSAACCLLAVAFILLTACLQWGVARLLPASLLADLLHHAAPRVAAPCFFSAALSSSIGSCPTARCVLGTCCRPPPSPASAPRLRTGCTCWRCPFSTCTGVRGRTTSRSASRCWRTSSPSWSWRGPIWPPTSSRAPLEPKRGSCGQRAV